MGLLGPVSRTTLQRRSLIAKAPQSRANSITVVSRPTSVYRIPIYGFSGVCRALGSSWQRILTFAQSHTAQSPVLPAPVQESFSSCGIPVGYFKWYPLQNWNGFTVLAFPLCILGSTLSFGFTQAVGHNAPPLQLQSWGAFSDLLSLLQCVSSPASPS